MVIPQGIIATAIMDMEEGGKTVILPDVKFVRSLATEPGNAWSLSLGCPKMLMEIQTQWLLRMPILLLLMASILFQ